MSCGCGCGSMNPCGNAQENFVDASGCGNVVPATPYGGSCCDSACPEDHCQKTYIQQFFASIRIDTSFNIPECGGTAYISVVNLKAIAIGSNIWNKDFGYFEVTAFNLATGQVTIRNNCVTGNSAPGSLVPGCTEFTVVDPPSDSDSTQATLFPYVAVDFTAPPVSPAPGSTINITVTNVNGLAVGKDIAIGSGEYLLAGVVDATHITITNSGLGLIPGTSVIALNFAGQYQYPIIQVDINPCSNPEITTGGTLLTCSNSHMAPLAGWTSWTPTVAGGPFTNPASVAYYRYTGDKTIEFHVTIKATFTDNKPDTTFTLPPGVLSALLIVQSLCATMYTVAGGPSYVPYAVGALTARVETATNIAKIDTSLVTGATIIGHETLLAISGSIIIA